MRHLTHFLALFLILVSVGSVGWAITIDYTPKLPLVGETVTLTAISDNNVTSYFWDFNDLNWIPAGNEPIYSDNTNDANTSAASRDSYDVWVIPKQHVWIRSVRVCEYSPSSGSVVHGTFTIYGSDGTTVLYSKTITFTTVHTPLLCWDFDVSDSNIILAPNEPIKIFWKDSATAKYYRYYPIESNTFIYRYYRDTNNPHIYMASITINYSAPGSDTLKVTSNTAGSYPITLNVTYDTGASESKTVNLNFYSPPYLEPETNTPYVDTDMNVYVRHDDRLTVTSITWDVNDSNATISTPSPEIGTFHFFDVGSKEIAAATTLSDGNNTRDANLSTTVDVQYITITPHLKYEITEEDWNTSAVDSTRMEVWDTETGEMVESVDNVTTRTFKVTRTHLYKLVAKVTYSTITFQRVRYIQGAGDVEFNVYLPDPKIALFYTIYLTDTSGLPLNGYKLVIERFINGVKAYIPISEAYPGPDGSTTHFLEPSVTYKVKVYSPDGSLAGQWDWTADPNVRTVTIRLPVGATATDRNIGTIHVEYNTPWQNLIITIPDNNEEVNAWPYTIEVGISDGSASLEQAQVSIYKAIFDVNVPRLDVNITDPAGGTVEYNAWSPGLYIIHIKIKKYGEWYDLPPRYVLLSGKSFLSGNFGLSDFGYILLATISSLSVAGFLSQFSPVGGAIGGLATMGFFTYLNPGATVVGVSMWHIFLLTAIMVLGVALIRTWI